MIKVKDVIELLCCEFEIRDMPTQKVLFSGRSNKVEEKILEHDIDYIDNDNGCNVPIMYITYLYDDICLEESENEEVHVEKENIICSSANVFADGIFFSIE